MDPLRPELLTWTGLLARWIEYAKSAVALPDDEEGERCRASVPAVINLQAVTFALAEVGDLLAPERPVARDRAAILIRDNAAALQAIWRGCDMPIAMREIGDDARAALEAAAWAGAEELIWPGPGVFEMPSVPAGEAAGTLVVMPPGTPVMPGETVAWWVDREPLEIGGCLRQRVARPVQVYRQVDEDGTARRDVVAPLDDELPPGLPLLVPLLEEGHPVGSFPVDEASWRDLQRRAVGERTLEVVFRDPARAISLEP